MGFVLTVLYIIITLISPEKFGPQWASYHVLFYLVGILFLFSLPNIFSGTQLRSSVQTFLMLGFIVAIALSAVANGWIGGALASWQLFLPSAAIFFFIVANVNTIRRLKIIMLAAVGSCLVIVLEALCGYYGGFRGDVFVLHQSLYSRGEVLGQIARLRGPGFLSDPNDFAQFLLIALPLVFIAWEKRRGFANSLIVCIPAALMLWAVYLTHSRGALIGLAILALMAARRRLGIKASAILTVAFILGMLALDFTGGRGISTVEGADRMEAWVSGLEMFKSAPLFGIGFGGFTNFNDITAHNSFVLCLAELGLLGSTIWVGLLVTTTLSLNNIIKAQRTRTGKTLRKIEKSEELAPSFSFAPAFWESLTATSIENNASTISEVEIKSEHKSLVPEYWPVAIRLSLIGFMVTSWFLSRSYQTPLYLILGLATAVIVLQRPAVHRIVGNRWVFSTLAVEVAAIMVIYGIGQLSR
jgi:putative inorganic carbon (HCO3(-)) transporter